MSILQVNCKKREWQLKQALFRKLLGTERENVRD